MRLPPRGWRLRRRGSLLLPLLAGLLVAGCAAAAPEAREAAASGPETAAPRTVAPEPVPEEPEMLLLASLADGSELAVIDPSRPDAEAVALVPAGAAPWGVGVDPGTGTAYAATAEGLAVIDLAALERRALVPFPHPASGIGYGEYRQGGLGLAVAPDGSRVYTAVAAADGGYYLEVYDAREGAFVASVPVGARPFDVVVAPDGGWAATIDHDSFTVTVVDAGTLAPVSYPVAPFGTEGGLASWEKGHYAAVDDDGAILLPYQGLTVIRLDPRSGAVTALPSAQNSHTHGTARAGRLLLTVGTGAFGNASGGPSLSILDLDTGEERIAPLAVPHETVATWRDAEGSEYAAIAGGNTRGEGWRGVTLVRLDDLTQRELPVPGYPQAIVAFARSGS